MAYTLVTKSHYPPAKYKVGDVVRMSPKQAAISAKKWERLYDETTISIFTGPLVIKSASDILQQYEFTYPPNHSTWAGKSFFLPLEYFELVTPAKPAGKQCDCEIKTLMLVGCCCKGA